MDQEHEQSHASSTAATTVKPATVAEVEPCQASCSAGLPKTANPSASGLIDKSFTPPKVGVVTGRDSLWLRGAPKTGPNSSSIRKIPLGEKMSVRSEVTTWDPTYPTWYGVTYGKMNGFVAADFVKIEVPSDRRPQFDKQNLFLQNEPQNSGEQHYHVFGRVFNCKFEERDPAKDKGIEQDPVKGTCTTKWNKVNFSFGDNSPPTPTKEELGVTGDAKSSLTYE